MSQDSAEDRALRWGAIMIGFAMMLVFLSLTIDFFRRLAPTFENVKSAPEAIDTAGIPYLALVILMTGTALIAFVVLLGRSPRAERTQIWTSRDDAMASPDPSSVWVTSGVPPTGHPDRREEAANASPSASDKQTAITERMPMVAHFGGVSEVIEAPDGSVEIRVYATREDALAAGLERDYIARLFHGVARTRAAGPCTQLIGPPKGGPLGEMVVACRKRTCHRTCVIYSRPKEVGSNKDWKKESGNPVPYDKKRFYKCECQ
jgi:hypothetical protein